MNRLLIGVFAVFLVLSAVPDGNAQPAYLQVYFDEALTETGAPSCPSELPATVIGYLYIVAHGFNAYLRAIEFRIDYPSEILWLGDHVEPGHLSIGNSPAGIALAFPTPLDARSPVCILRVTILWLCQECNDGLQILFCPNVHPSSGYLRAVRWPDFKFIHATAGTSIVCLSCLPELGYWCRCGDLPVPVAETTWGQIKVLYK